MFPERDTSKILLSREKGRVCKFAIKFTTGRQKLATLALTTKLPAGMNHHQRIVKTSASASEKISVNSFVNLFCGIRERKTSAIKTQSTEDRHNTSRKIDINQILRRRRKLGNWETGELPGWKHLLRQTPDSKSPCLFTCDFLSWIRRLHPISSAILPRPEETSNGALNHAQR